ncbi:hypothetical protein Nepgr_011379 [Nepenthes gracilis]|uniref:Uncharacterized protein n=1 Tax=Nepenthes gracilis TaxID=150966 RepID=A0AAD3XLW9_NEPGR|nr:hypothetical protein Nepgr_011379 [Nepenthes gracilis]
MTTVFGDIVEQDVGKFLSTLTQGSILLEDYQLVEKLASFGRKRIPKRVVYAKRASAMSFFEVMQDVSSSTCFDFLWVLDFSTPVIVQFSTIVARDSPSGGVREVEAIGGSLNASASRKQKCYLFDALKTYVLQMVKLLVDCADVDNTHVALAIEIPDGWRNKIEFVLATAFQMLLGGEGSFSAGSPRKGMHSRLYHRILNEHQEIQSFSAFNSIYNSIGIFDIHASTGADYVGNVVSLVVGELISIITFGQVQ